MKRPMTGKPDISNKLNGSNVTRTLSKKREGNGTVPAREVNLRGAKPSTAASKKRIVS